MEGTNDQASTGTVGPSLLLLPTFAEAQGVKVSSSIDEMEMAAGVDPYDAAAHHNLALGYWSE